MFLSIYLSFLHYVYLSQTKSNEIDFKFKNDLLIKKKNVRFRWIKIGHEFKLLKLANGFL